MGWNNLWLPTSCAHHKIGFNYMIMHYFFQRITVSLCGQNDDAYLMISYSESFPSLHLVNDPMVYLQHIIQVQLC